MSGKVFGRVVRLTAIVSAAATLGAAHAAKYTGTWDPLYGNPFPYIGWRGEATFEFDGGCLATFTNNCSGIASVLQATVEFYDIRVGTDTTSPALARLNWTTSNPVDAATFAGANLTAVVTDFLDAPAGGAQVSFTDAGLASTVDDLLASYGFFLEFLGDRARLAHVRLTEKPAPKSPNCANQQSDPNEAMCGFSDPDPNAGAGTFMTFAAVSPPPNPVPEPTTYALMLAGLAAIGLVTRRRHA